METVKDDSVEKLAAREKLENYWKGRYRYFQVSEGQRYQLPAYMYTEWYTPEGIHREVCTGLEPHTNEPIWMPAADAPAPRAAFDPDVSTKSVSQQNPAAAMPPFDYVPPAYASDTQSGGPSNFDGEKGGDDNPRNPLLEGEVPNEYADAVAAFREQLLALEAEVSALKAPKPKRASPKKAGTAAESKPDAEPQTGEDALNNLINGKSK